jgi:hypothetical protein
MKKTLIALMMMGLSTGAMADDISNKELLEKIKILENKIDDLQNDKPTGADFKVIVSMMEYEVKNKCDPNGIWAEHPSFCEQAKKDLEKQLKDMEKYGWK